MFKDKKILAIIPARGGSKRIKNKNIINFKGEPMIAATIRVAKKCKFIDKVIVSTDSKNFKISKKYKINTPFLRESAFDDKSSVQEATLVAIKQTEKYLSSFDVVIQLMPNCPIRKLDTLNSSIINFLKLKKSQISF